MGKAIQGAAMLGAAFGLGAAMMLDPALMVTPMTDKLMESLVVGGLSMEAGAIADALMQNRGMNITTRQPASFRQIIYGTQRIGGVIIYRSTTGSHHDQYNFVIVLATHEIAAIEALYLDGRRVYFESGSSGQKTSPDGTVFGGFADSNQYTGPNGQYYNFGSLVYCEARFGNQAEGDVIGGLTANDPIWAADSSGNSPWVGGCAYVYLKVEYDANMFPGEPEIRFTVRGKNDILDPRTGATGYTDNWALIIADAITDTTWGLGDDSVNQAQLIAAANVCDEQVTLASGSTEARYCCHWHYDTSTSVGNAIETMMSAAAGRLSRIGGEWYIWPAYWQGPTLSFGLDDLAGEVDWQPNRSIADLFNRVTGTYIAPNYPYNVAGNLYDSNGWYDGSIQNNFPFAFQPTNYPEYACDQLHGYGTGVDVYLTQDGGIELPKEIAQPCVLSVAQAQRLAKINLLRNRQQGTGILPMGLSGLKLQPLAVMQFTFAAHGWSNKQLEVQGFNWLVDRSGKDRAPRLMLQAKVGETDQSVYEWAATEELSVYDVPAAPQGVPYIVDPPTNLAIEDDSTTVGTLTDGTAVPRMLVSWTPPEDVYVNNGGKIQVQYQFQTTTSTKPVFLSPTQDTVSGIWLSLWVDAGSVSGDATSMYVPGITPEQYQEVNVRVRAVRANGAVSNWAVLNNHTVTGIQPVWPVAGKGGSGGSGPILLYGSGGKSIFELQPAEPGADVTGSNNAAGVQAGNTYRLAQDVIDSINSGGGLNFATPGHTGTLDFSTYIAGRTADKVTYTNGGATVDSLQPSQAGADVTGQNTAQDTTSVAGVPAGAISQGASGINTNLIPDSDFKFGTVYWSLPAGMQLNNTSAAAGTGQVMWDAGYTGGNTLSAEIPVYAGHVYTLSGYIDAASATAGSTPNWNVYFSDGSYGAGAYQSAGSKGRVSFTFTVPSGVSSLQVNFGGSKNSSDQIWFLTPMLQVGSVATAYQPSLLDNTTGYFKAGASQIDLSSSIHLNKTANNISYLSGGTVDSYKPAEAGADVTSQNQSATTASLSNHTLDNLANGSSRYAANESGADSTTNHHVAVPGSFPSSVMYASGPTTGATLASVTVDSAGPSDLFLLLGTFAAVIPTGMSSEPTPINTIEYTVDGGSTNYAYGSPAPTGTSMTYMGAITGLAAGTHTIAVVAYTDSAQAEAQYSANSCFMVVQHFSSESGGFNNAPSGGSQLSKPSIS